MNVSVIFLEPYFSNMSKWYILFHFDPGDRVLFRYDRGCSSWVTSRGQDGLLTIGAVACYSQILRIGELCRCFCMGQPF